MVDKDVYAKIRFLFVVMSDSYQTSYSCIRGRAKAGTQEEQAKHFKWGLNDYILDRILNTEFTDVAQVANAARNVEIFRDMPKNEGNNKRDRDGHRIRPSDAPAQGSNQRAYDRRDSDRYGNEGIYSNKDRYRNNGGRSDRQGSDKHGGGGIEVNAVMGPDIREGVQLSRMPSLDMDLTWDALLVSDA
nr:zinc finger, CCHC-type, retrotransposon Gag domain protein [Tanacetum cinerariifolium]